MNLARSVSTRLVLATFLSFGAVSTATARAPVPIVNHANVSITSASGQQASAEQVASAIRAAAVATGRKWDVVEPAPGRLVATYHVRTHTVSIEIRYTASAYSVAYKDSVNMKYTPDAQGPGSIHPFYNQWVDEFMRAINAELRKA
jgi:hypothetical protein